MRTTLLPVAASTNDELKRLALRGEASPGDAVAADRQTGGRGRLGRSFFSPPGGIYVSVYLEPDLPPERIATVSAAAAAASCRALDTVGIRAGIKWINDLIYGGKKLGDILCEAVADAGMHIRGCIVGVGINCCPEGTVFPDELADIAAVVTMDEPCRRALRDALIAELRAVGDGTAPDWYFYYRERSVVLGREVRVIPCGRPEFRARVVEIEDSGTLTVEDESGQIQTLSGGEISLRL